MRRLRCGILAVVVHERREHRVPLTQIDPRVALVVVDLQQGILALPTAHPVEAVVANAAAMAAAFRERELPVVLVTVAGAAPGRTDAGGHGGARPAGWDTLAPELDAQPGDHRIVKHTWGAFQDTTLAAYLTEQGVTQLVLAGVSTSIGVESTARGAYERGLHVVLVTDAMTDTRQSSHDNSVEAIFPRLGETTTTADLLAALDGQSPKT